MKEQRPRLSRSMVIAILCERTSSFPFVAFCRKNTTTGNQNIVGQDNPPENEAGFGNVFDTSLRAIPMMEDVMQFQFYMLAQGDQGVPVLSPVGLGFERTVDNTMGTLRKDAIADAEARFAELIRSHQPGEGQIVLITATLGEPPGSVIAVEVIDSFPGHRRLQWAWSDGSIQI